MSTFFFSTRVNYRSKLAFVDSHISAILEDHVGPKARTPTPTLSVEEPIRAEEPVEPTEPESELPVVGIPVTASMSSSFHFMQDDELEGQTPFEEGAEWVQHPDEQQQDQDQHEETSSTAAVHESTTVGTLDWSAEDEHGDSLPPIQGLHAHFGTPQGDTTPVAAPSALPPTDEWQTAASATEGAQGQHQQRHTTATATGGGGYTSSSSAGRGGRHHLPEPDAEGFVNIPTKRSRGGGGEHHRGGGEHQHRGGGRGRGERREFRGRGSGEWRGSHRGGVPGGAGEGAEYGSGGEQGDRPRGGWRGRDRGDRGDRGEGGRGEHRGGRGRGEWRGRSDGYRGGEHRGRGEGRGGGGKVFSKSEE